LASVVVVVVVSGSRGRSRGGDSGGNGFNENRTRVTPMKTFSSLGCSSMFPHSSSSCLLLCYHFYSVSFARSHFPYSPRFIFFFHFHHCHPSNPLPLFLCSTPSLPLFPPGVGQRHGTARCHQHIRSVHVPRVEQRRVRHHSQPPRPLSQRRRVFWWVRGGVRCR